MSELPTLSHTPETGLYEVFGIGNPIIDLTALRSDDTIQKYSLNKGGFLFEGEAQKGLLDELESDQNSVITAGGSVVNSMRICQAFLSKTPHSTFYAGCVGNDSLAKQFTECLRTAQVGYRLQISTEAPTGVCGVVISEDKDRSLCTRIGAAALYPTHKIDIFADYIKQSRFLYSSGFFLLTNFEMLMNIASYINTLGPKPPYFCFNLSAASIIEPFGEKFIRLIPYIDIMFGSAEEFATLHEVIQKTLSNCAVPDKFDCEAAATLLLNMEKERSKIPRIVIMTNGPKPTLVAMTWFENKHIVPKFKKYPAMEIEKIVDLNGAGDAFVGGFFGGACSTWTPEMNVTGCRFNMDYAIYAAHLASSKIIQNHGCNAKFDVEDYATYAL